MVSGLLSVLLSRGGSEGNAGRCGWGNRPMLTSAAITGREEGESTDRCGITLTSPSLARRSSFCARACNGARATSGSIANQADGDGLNFRLS